MCLQNFSGMWLYFKGLHKVKQIRLNRNYRGSCQIEFRLWIEMKPSKVFGRKKEKKVTFKNPLPPGHRSCFDKGCTTKVYKRTRQCQLALWVVRVWLCFIEFQGDSSTRNEKEQIHVFLLFPSTTLKHLGVQSSNRKTTITHNNFQHCRVSFSSFIRQPYSNSCM